MTEKEKHYHEAVTLFGKGDLDGSLKAYQKALELDPQYLDALQGAAVAYERKGELDQAAAHCLKVVRNDPNHLLAHTELSIVFQKLGMTHSAEQMGSVARVLSWKDDPESKNSESSPFNII